MTAPREQGRRPISPVLMYDGNCALCNGAVRFVLRHDRAQHIRFAALDGNYARRVKERHQCLEKVDSLVLVEFDESGAERIHVKSEAAIGVARRLGHGWSLAGALKVVPRGLRDAVYDLIARSRYRIMGRLEACPLPAPEVRHRFLP